ncbi:MULTISPECIES: OmpA family protein [Maritimibacter]|jgi:outer membrane protein OmpA-like peptidoglycan-associated protein|nr:MULTISPECIES: OmpA family protein [Maritimibacter]MBL6428403.1 OmpA family protein [Maritimibacter sp.]TYP85117.1 outer membrane protein OmpA-like peptidoglycan-associated protein [Maritimibacter alkaliphilus HTCC2654]
MTTLKPLFVLPLVSVLALTGCSTVGQREGAGIATGAAVGGLVGAAIPGNRAATAAAGAIGGAIVGGLVGNQLDKQAGDLRSSLSNSSIQVINTGSYLKVVMPQGILFPTDSADVSPALYPDLRALAENLREYPNSSVQVVGHTDNTGQASYNLTLSQRRAQAVLGVIQSNGVGAARLQAVGKGDSEPVATNLTPEGRAQNRRVEVLIIPRG